MAEDHSPEQETQHEKRREASQEVPIDPADIESGIEQETQHAKRAAAQSGGQVKRKESADEDESD